MKLNILLDEILLLIRFFLTCKGYIDSHICLISWDDRKCVQFLDSMIQNKAHVPICIFCVSEGRTAFHVFSKNIISFDIKKYL